MPLNDSKLMRDLRQIPVIDTHEHLFYDDALELPDYPDVLNTYLLHYMRSDIVSAGLSQENLSAATDMARPLAERWKILEPYWDYSRFTGYGRSLDISVRELYGIDGIRAETVEELQKRYSEKNRAGHTAWVLKEKCGIAVSYVDLAETIMESMNPLFMNVWQPSEFIIPGVNSAERFYSCTDLDAWCAAAVSKLDNVLAHNNCRVIKFAFAYQRSLLVEAVTKKRAEECFRALKAKSAFEGFDRELQDYMIRFILQAAAERELTVQIHTGHIEGNGGDVRASDPTLLIPVIQEFPGVRFDLFHIGYPYHGSLISMCKTYPNVYADMCWAHILSPSASRAFLYEFLQVVPYNKLSAFGGDYFFPDGVYGHLEICRENIAQVLGTMINEGLLRPEQALKIADSLFYENPVRILQWKGKKPKSFVKEGKNHV